jgi:hypothetical protein
MRKVLVCKWPAVDRLSASSIALGKVCEKFRSFLSAEQLSVVELFTPALNHKIGDRTMNYAVLIIQWPV